MVNNTPEYMSKYMDKRRTKDKHKENAMRMVARRKAEKEWKVTKWWDTEVDHKNWVKAGNGASNLRVVSRETNRRLWAEKAIRTRKSRLAKGWKY